MKKLCLLVLMAFTYLNAQTDKEKAMELGRQAIEEMEAGKINESIEHLQQAMKLDPGNINYPYEIGFALYLNKQHADAAKLMKKLTKHPNVTDRIYQMLGNSLDMSGKPKKAIAAYEEGLKLFPNSGSLYLERANMEMHKKNYNEALNLYEKGIKVDPTFSSNYYWASKLYLSSSEEVWGMLYGEIFMNLERGSKRTSEISKMLYKTYNEEIKFTSDTSMTVSFSNSNVIDLASLDKGQGFKMPYGVGVYEPTLLMSIIQTKEINLASLDKIRSSFVDHYEQLGHTKKYPNVVFDYQNKVIEAGHMTAYNYWLLSEGNPEEFETWYNENEEEFKAFVEWFTQNPMQITEKNKFHSSDY